MLSIFRPVLMAFVAVVFVACGGGSDGGGDATPSFAGNFQFPHN